MASDRNAPATKGDLEDSVAGLRTEMSSDIAQLRSELREESTQLRSEMRHISHDLKESMRDVQTELLKAFYSFAQTTDARMKDCETSDIGMRLRLSAVEGRLTDIEKRLNLPPAA